MKWSSCLYALFIAITSLMCCPSRAQTINTIAGTGTSGFSGDGGAATLAMLSQAWGLEIDPATGDIYFSDFQNYRVRKINSSGVVTTIAGNGSSAYSGDGGPATAAGISGPTDLAIYGGELYIGEVFSSRVRKVNAAGIITTVAGNGISGTSGDGGPATLASISSPNGIAVDNFGNILICDQNTQHIRKVTPSGIISTIAGSGATGYSGDGGPATMASMHLPDQICADAAGNVYFSDFYNNVVRRISTSGIITTFAGNGIAGFSGDGGPATSAKLHGPAGVHFDLAGNLYVCDATNNRIRKVATDGIISTIAGIGTAGFSGDGGPALLAQLNNVNLARPDASGNVYVGDMYNHRIRKIVYANSVPVFTTGASTSLTVCENAAPTSINSLLAITDADVGQTETWDLWVAPLHGTAMVSYSTTSTGGTITPTGLTYTPATGYAGADSFKVRVSDGIGADTITVFVTINPLPDTGFIIGASSVCAGTSVIYASTLGGGSWSSSNPSVATVNSGGAVSGISIGTAVISYSISNSCGTAIDTQAVVVTSSPSAFILGGITGLCNGAMASMTGSPVGGTWASSSTGIATVTTVGVVGGAGTGTAIITYTITNSCGTASDTQMITVSPLPAATVSGPPALCLGASSTFTGTPSGGTWNTSNSAVATVNSSGYVNSLSAGTTLISYTSSNSCGSATDTAALLVVPLPDAGVITAPSILCVGASMSISNSVSGGNWSIAPVSVATIGSSSGTITGLSVGTAVLTYSVPPDDHGCTNAVTFPVLVIQGLTVTDSISDIKCTGDTGSIVLAVSGGVGPYQYMWSDGSSTNAVNNLAPGIYAVTISDPASGCVAKDSFTISTAVPMVLSSVQVNDRCSERHGEIDITVTGGTSPYSFSWSTGAATEDVTNLLAGVYSVTVRDANQCTNEFSIVVGEDSCGQIVIHDVITPNGDGINDAWVIDGLSTRPNTSVTVFDKWGDAVFKADNYDNTWSGKGTNGNLIPDGTYFYLVTLAEKDNFTGKKDFTGSLLIKR